MTIGVLQTDPEQHAFSKVPGETRFSIDARALSHDTLDAFETELKELCGEIEKARKVTFELGQRTGTASGSMDADLLDSLGLLARASGISYRLMGSGGGHDATVFARNGVPTALIFVRTQNGGHNPDEGMDQKDLDQAISLMSEFLERY